MNSKKVEFFSTSWKIDELLSDLFFISFPYLGFSSEPIWLRFRKISEIMSWKMDPPRKLRTDYSSFAFSQLFKKFLNL